MNTVEQLTQVFCDNFMAYFRSHVSHVNVVGRSFRSDHALFGDIYEDLQEQIDIIAELLRTLDSFMPNNLHHVMQDSHIGMESIEGSSIELLEKVKDDLSHLKMCYEDLMMISENEGHKEIANYAQDRILAISKHIWMLNSTLE